MASDEIYLLDAIFILRLKLHQILYYYTIVSFNGQPCEVTMDPIHTKTREQMQKDGG